MTMDAAEAGRSGDAGITGRAFAIGFAVILAIAAFVRLRALGVDSLWRDEAVTWFEAQGSIAQVVAATARDNYPPLHNLSVAASMALFGDGEWALRLPSAVFGVANVAAIYWVGRLIADRTVGLLAALLLALSAYDIWYSQEARAYALLALTATLFAGAALWFMRRPTLARGAAAFVSAAALLYTHPYGGFIWLGIGGAVFVILLMRRESDVRAPLIWVAAQIAAAAVFAPWAWVLLQQTRVIEQNGFWIPTPSVDFVTYQLFTVASGPLVFVLAALAAGIGFVRVPAADGDAVRPGTIQLAASDDTWVVVAWMVVPLVLGIGVSLIGTPVFIARYAIGSLPPFLLLAAMGLCRFVDGRRSFAAVIALSVAVSAFGMAYGMPPPREDWRRAAPFVTADMPPGGCLLVPDAGYDRVLSYYVRKPLPCILHGAAEAGSFKGDFLVAVTTVGGSRALFAALPPAVWEDGTIAETFNGLLVVPFRRVAAN